MSQRESKEGKLNSLSLWMIDGGGNVTKEEAIEAIKGHFERAIRELLGLVLQENTTIPSACKDVFWKLMSIVNLFYMEDDGYTSNRLMNTVKAMFEQPMDLDALLNK